MRRPEIVRDDGKRRAVRERVVVIAKPGSISMITNSSREYPGTPAAGIYFLQSDLVVMKQPESSKEYMCGAEAVSIVSLKLQQEGYKQPPLESRHDGMC